MKKHAVPVSKQKIKRREKKCISDGIALTLLSRQVGSIPSGVHISPASCEPFEKKGCGNLQNDAFSTFISSVKTRRDYAEAVSVVFNFKIQSKRFGIILVDPAFLCS
jgi:hypothetical protein